MTQELIDKIVTKIFVIEQDLSLIKKWLENGTDKDVEFLAEMNATNQPDPQSEYTATMIVEAPPSVPDLEGIEPLAETTANVDESRQIGKNKEVQELAKRLDLEPTGEAALGVDAELWARLMKTFVIAGWNMRKLLDSEWWKKQSLTLTPKEAKRLDELSLLRDQMILKEMDLAQVQGQNGMTEIEKAAFAELAQKENLK